MAHSSTSPLPLALIASLCLAAPTAQAALADGHAKFLGNVLQDDDEIEDSFARYWNQATTRRSLKWRWVEAERDRMDWTDLDAHTAFCQRHGFPLKGHALIWGKYYPEWIQGLSQAELAAEIDEFFQLVFERYPGMESIDVVNEPVNTRPTFHEALGGPGETGYDWVIHAFERARHHAREHGSDAKLLINEYHVLRFDKTLQAYLKVARLLQERGLIDGLGVQGHNLEGVGPEALQARLDQLATLGLPIYLSEYDVLREDDLEQQAIYMRQFPVFWHHPAVVGATLWCYIEGQRKNPGFLLRADLSERPAVSWLRGYLQWNAETELRFEAERCDESQGVKINEHSIGQVDGGDWIRFAQVDLGEGFPWLKLVYARGSSSPGHCAIHLDAPDGPLLGRTPTLHTSGWSVYRPDFIALEAATGVHDVYLVFTGDQGIGNVDWFAFGLLRDGGHSQLRDVEMVNPPGHIWDCDDARLSRLTMPQVTRFSGPVLDAPWRVRPVPASMQ